MFIKLQNGATLKVSARGVNGSGPDPAPAQIELAKNFLAGCKRIKKPGLSSYFLKHVCEELASTATAHNYVSNGALIVAAAQLGLAIKPHGGKSLNAAIGVSRVGLKQFYGSIG